MRYGRDRGIPPARRMGLVVVLVWIGLACIMTGCSTSDKIRKLPPPEGLPDLRNLEKHLDYVDPDDGRPDYIPRRTQS